MHESKVAGAVYGGILLNNNHMLVDRIAKRLFRGQVQNGKDLGFVAIYHGTRAVAATLRGPDHLPVVGFELHQSLRKPVLSGGQTEISYQNIFGTDYICATDPDRKSVV